VAASERASSVIQPTTTVAGELGITEGAEILIRERTMSESGEVLALAGSFFDRSLTRGTAIEAEDTGPGGVLACLLRLR
jgi:GntR family transcriptional regulator